MGFEGAGVCDAGKAPPEGRLGPDETGAGDGGGVVFVVPAAVIAIVFSFL